MIDQMTSDEMRATYPEAERSFLSVEWERVTKSQRQTINRLEQEKAEVWRVAADELEAMRIERDNWKLSAEEAERAEKRWKDRAVEAERERDALAAVVEKAEDFVTRHYLDTRFGDEVLPILASAPADALREVKADVWDEGFSHCFDSEYADGGASLLDNPYKADT